MHEALPAFNLPEIMSKRKTFLEAKDGTKIVIYRAKDLTYITPQGFGATFVRH